MQKILSFRIISILSVFLVLFQWNTILGQNTSSNIFSNNQIANCSDSSSSEILPNTIPQMMMNNSTFEEEFAALSRELKFSAKRENSSLLRESTFSARRANPTINISACYLQRESIVPIVIAQEVIFPIENERNNEYLPVAQPIDRPIASGISTSRSISVASTLPQDTDDLRLEEFDEIIVSYVTEVRDTKINSVLAGIQKAEERRGGEKKPGATIAEYRNKVVEAQDLENQTLASYWLDAVQAYERGATYWIDSDQAFSASNKLKGECLGFGNNFNGGSTSFTMLAAILLVQRAETYMKVEEAEVSGKNTLANCWREVIKAHERGVIYLTQLASSYASENREDDSFFGEYYHNTTKISAAIAAKTAAVYLNLRAEAWDKLEEARIAEENTSAYYWAEKVNRYQNVAIELNQSEVAYAAGNQEEGKLLREAAIACSMTYQPLLPQPTPIFHPHHNESHSRG